MSARIKTISIRNFKGIPMVAPDILEKKCKILETDIAAILNGEQTQKSLEELYSIVESVDSMYKILQYENLHALIRLNLLEKVAVLEKKEEIIFEVDKIWRSFCAHLKIIKNIFLCFDKSSKNKFNTVHVMGLHLFRNIVLMNTEIKRNLRHEIFYWIEVERREEKIDLPLIQSVISMLTELDAYDDLFQQEFLRLTEVFYADEGNFLIKTYSVPEYLYHVNKRIVEEQERAKNYLTKYTGYATLEIVCKNLIKEHLTEILTKGFSDLMKKNNIGKLTLMYKLLTKVTTGGRLLLDFFSEYIINEGTKIMNTPDNDKNMIQELLSFKDQLDNIVEIAFNSNYNFWEVIRNTFSKFINIRKIKPAQLLAKYVDSKLRSKELTDADLEEVFNKVMVIFRFIQGKDVFMAFYKRDLAKRLLLGKSTSQDAEDSIIAKLKNECGDNFTSKIEGMFKDISISQSINSSFKQHLKNIQDDKSGTDLCINVLTNSFWPNYPNFDINLPPDLLHYQTAFQKFYSYNHSGRKLIWQQSLAHCVLKANFDCGNKEFQVSLFQALALLLFNNNSKLSFAEIQELTNLEKNELKRTMLSLACGKTRVLNKHPRGVDVKDDDMFHLNVDFHDKLFRIKINQIQLKDTVEEETAIESSVLVDRQFQIDAAIVRIMKKRMTINHNALLADLFNVLDIPVKPHDLKKRIELLIEREYMERDKDNPANYTYIA